MHFYFPDFIIVMPFSLVFLVVLLEDLTKTTKFDPITPILASLHWLPVQARADFMVNLLTHKALHGLAPPYLSEVIIPYTPTCSLNAGLLIIPSVNKKKAFHYMLKCLWHKILTFRGF